MAPSVATLVGLLLVLTCVGDTVCIAIQTVQGSVLGYQHACIQAHAFTCQRAHAHAYTVSILYFSLNLSVGVRKLQCAILARSYREMSLTVRVVRQYILSRVRVSVRPSKFFIRAKHPKPRGNRVASVCVI